MTIMTQVETFVYEVRKQVFIHFQRKIIQYNPYDEALVLPALVRG